MAELFGPLLYFNVLSLKDKNSLSFTRVQCLVLGSAALVSSFENVLKLKRGDLISWGETILECRTAELFGPPFCISFLQVWRNQVIFSFIRFQCIVHDSAGTFIDFQNSLKLKRGEPILQNGWIIWSSLLHFKFKTLKNSKSLSFIRFQFVMRGWAVFLTFFQNLERFKKVDLISWRGNQFCKMTEIPVCISLTKIQGLKL